MPKLLIVDDEPSIRFSIEQVFAGQDVAILGAQTADEALKLAAEESPDVILLDVRLGDRSGLEVFGDLKRIDARSMVVFITGHGTADTAIEAMKLGAYDYLLKPLDAAHLRQVVEQALKISRLMHTPTNLDEGPSPDQQPDRLVGSSPAMQAVCKKIGRLAQQDVNVLILGESGTGKELVARALYHHSRRAEAPFVAINCAAIPEALLESELFGHERGAFSGADRRRIGSFEQCNGGTLLLDEVGETSPHTQARILRLLQEGRLERVGGNQSIAVDVRIFAATNQDLNQLIEQGRLRKDLYYRLRGATILLPPLRERRDDIPELAHYFLFRQNRILGTSVQSISQPALELMADYGWPGNVRELHSAVREALIVSAGPTVLAESLPAELHAQPGTSTTESPEPDTDAPAIAAEAAAADWQRLPEQVEAAIGDGRADVYRRARQEFDRLLILRVLRQTGGNQIAAAEMLGLSRVTLRARLRELKIGVAKTVTAGTE